MAEHPAARADRRRSLPDPALVVDQGDRDRFLPSFRVDFHLATLFISLPRILHPVAPSVATTTPYRKQRSRPSGTARPLRIPISPATSRQPMQTLSCYIPTHSLLYLGSCGLSPMPSFRPSVMYSFRSFPAGIASFSGTGRPAFKNYFASCARVPAVSSSTRAKATPSILLVVIRPLRLTGVWRRRGGLCKHYLDQQTNRT